MQNILVFYMEAFNPAMFFFSLSCEVQKIAPLF